MKKLLLTVGLTLFLILSVLIAVLSITGYETDKFNKLISEKINENNRNITLNLDKIKFRIDIKEVSLFLETKNPKLRYQNLDIPIENIKVYLDFISLIISKPKMDKMNISSKEININQLKNIIIKTKPSSLNSLITNKVKNGKLAIDIEIYFNDNLNIDNIIARGEVKEMQATVYDDLVLKDTSFSFFADTSDVLIKNIKSKMDGFLINNGNLKIEKDKNINIQADFFTKLNINKTNIKTYLTYIKNFKYSNKETNLKANSNHNLDITFDNTFKVINYVYKNTGRLDKLDTTLNHKIKSSFLDDDITNLSLKDSDFKIRYSSDKKNFITSNGSYRVNNFDFNNYNFTNNYSKDASNIELDFEFAQQVIIDLINYKKKTNKVANISLSFLKKKNHLNFKNINYKENKNSISIENLKVKKNDIISFGKIKVKTYEEGDLKNDFKVDFAKKITINGKKYDAKNLNKILNLKSKNNPLKKINKEIDINLENILTPLSKKLKNFKLIGIMEKGKFVKISSKGDFGNNKFLDISLKSDKKSKKKYLEIYSDLPRPLLSEYSFFNGLSEGVLIFSSIMEEGEPSTSKLLIEDFKVINAPGVVKLLSLADFGGLADLAEGEGLSFEKLEIKMSNNKDLLKLEELYAIGPSISVLMDGYKDSSGLTSLRGTLVPAKNLNKLLSKIPVIGKIIIPKEIGEGLFGVSFKMKGPPGKIKTTINPIKTLTPRFITKALERPK